jgi:ribosomal protein S18 acetylase RimI-like enzyme
MSTFTYLLRPITETDLSTIYRFFPDNDPNRLIQTSSALAIVAEYNSHIIAFGQISRWRHCAEISDLIVQEAYRNQGIGTALINHLLEYALKMDVSCVEIGADHDNHRAIALYRRLGFQDHRSTEQTIYLKRIINQPSPL